MIQTFLSRVVSYGRIIDVDMSASENTIKIELQRGGGQGRLVLILRDVRVFGAMLLQVDTSRPLNTTAPSSPCASPYPPDVLFDLFWADIDTNMVEFPHTSADFVRDQINDPRWVSWWPHNAGVCEADDLVHMVFHDAAWRDEAWCVEVVICASAAELYMDGVLCSAEKLFKEHLSRVPVRLGYDMNTPPLREIKLSASDWVGLPEGLLAHLKPTQAWVGFGETALVEYHLHAIHDWFIDARRAFINVRAEQFYHASAYTELVDVQVTFWRLDQWVLYESYHVTV